jgi:triacylglycerol lipase
MRLQLVEKVTHRRSDNTKRQALPLAVAAAFAAATLTLATPAAAQYTQTKYPIVLVHGLFGFDKLVGVYDYFYRVPDALKSDGAKVFVAEVSAANSSEQRGEQLIRQLETLRATSGAQKFNLIGHSHGGPTIRYVASVRPDLVSSVLTSAAPHTGSKVADATRATLPPGSVTERAVSAFVNAFAGLIGFFSGNTANPQDSVAALNSLSSDGAARFNAKYPQGMPTAACGTGAAVTNGVRNYSIAGTSVFTNVLDVSDPVLGLSSVLFWGEVNDGLVGRCSSHFGTVLRDDYWWNHGDSANQVLGLRGLFASDPTSVYRAHANRLKNLGL